MKHILLLILFLSATVGAFSQDLPDPMSPRRIVNDLAGMFSSQELNTLEYKLRSFNDSTSTQIAIATVPSLDGYAPNDYAQRLAEKWGIGQKGKDNGILILIKPKGNREKGEVAIAVGYGLEGAIPDAIASRIIRNEIIPAFQQGQYYAGVDKATSVLMGLSKGEYTADQYAKKTKKSEGGILPILIPIAIFILFPLLIRRRKGYTAGHNAAGGAAAAIPPFIFWGGGHRGGSDFGSFSSGGGSFGGFGGGGFGGGGASGSW